MSLINKMLQDLDARGTPPGGAFPSQIKPVARERAGLDARLNKRVLAGCIAAAFAGVGLAWFAWGQLHAPRTVAEAVPAKAAAVAAPGAAPAAAAPSVPVKAPPHMTSTITMLPTAVPAPAAASGGASASGAASAAAPAGAAAPAAAPAVAATVPPAAAGSAPEPVPAKTSATDVAKSGADTPRASRPRPEAAAPKHKAGVAAAPAEPAPARPPAKSVAPVEPGSEEAHAVRRALFQELEARQARKPAARPRPAAAPATGRDQSVAQRAEGEYRRALASMQDGRMGETIAALESALRIDPSHEAARQTLVGLFIEARRPDDAIRQLQLGLTQDPRQPALAMLLARLQIERGGSGIETLARTLPYAGANPDYHAFLAGALQRQQRHREAAAEYQAALRGAPANGVWWMGMGISLQAEKRNAEALEAFRKAQASGALSAELQAFVERQIVQLGR